MPCLFGSIGGRPDEGIGPYIVLTSFVSFISAGAAKIHSLRCSSSPQRDRWRWVTLGAPNGHLPPLGGEGLLGAFYRLPPLGGKLASEARLMRGRMIEPRADENIRPYES